MQERRGSVENVAARDCRTRDFRRFVPNGEFWTHRDQVTVRCEWCMVHASGELQLQ
jgi:hypothetical protein